jgi:pyruvate formate lyase activating enzyme
VGGCNLRCLYCQNWQQSQTRPERLKTWDLPPRRAATGAQEGKLETIALTYTEPVVFSEYALAIAAHTHRRNIKLVVASGAYMNPGPMKELAQNVDGMCLALKGFTETFYRDVIGAKLKPVLDALVAARDTDTWLEVTTLIVPTLNDDMKALRRMAIWIKKNLGAETPLHFARFFPDHKLKNLPWTPPETITRAREVALDVGLKYVYVTNLAPHEGSSTSCPHCKQMLIRRVGFKLTEQKLRDGKCCRCKRKLPGVWA